MMGVQSKEVHRTADNQNVELSNFKVSFSIELCRFVVLIGFALLIGHFESAANKIDLNPD